PRSIAFVPDAGDMARPFRPAGRARRARGRPTGTSFWVEWCQEIPDFASRTAGTTRSIGATGAENEGIGLQRSAQASSEARLDLQPALQGQGHRRALGDLGHALLLLVVRAVDGEDALDVLLLAVADELHVGLHRRHRPLLALGIHAQGD